jgi:hypothetical protein
MNCSSFPPTPRLVSTLFVRDAAIAITNINDWLAVRVPFVTPTLAEYVPAGVALPATKESVPVNPSAAAANCEVTPLGKLPAATETALPVFAPLTVTATVPGVPF